LRSKLGFDATAVDRIVCRMPPGGMRVLTYPRPTTGLEGKFSLPYTLAAGALDGKYTLETFTDAAVRRPEIERFYARIQAAEDPSCRGDDPQFEKRSSGSRGFVEVEVKLRDGRSDRVRVDKAPGAPTRDLTWDELRTKFMDCARQSQRITQDAAGRAFEAIRNLEQADDIGNIVRLLR
jgi:2-methylcitrate dehydratase PrpD